MYPHVLCLILVGEVEEALALNPGEFEAKYGAKKPSKQDTNIVFHCRAGVRSLSALQSAHQMGYSRLVRTFALLVGGASISWEK